MSQTRRDWLGLWLRPLASACTGGLAVESPAGAQVKKAVIKGRSCLSYRQMSCTVCLERCPVEGAITLQQGVPRVNAALCTGCGICEQVCPAPETAIAMIPAKFPTRL